MKSLFYFLILYFSTQCFAVDLSKVSNSDLLNEIERRLSTPVSEKPVAVFSAICANADIELSIDSENGTETLKKFVGAKECQTTLTSLSKKLGNFSGLRIVAVCSQSNLVKVTLNSIGKITETSTFVGAGNCQAQADAINQR